MKEKIRRPKVSIPSYVKDMAMLSPNCRGKIDRQYIKFMSEAIYSYNKHRSDNMKKVYKDLTDE